MNPQAKKYLAIAGLVVFALQLNPVVPTQAATKREVGISTSATLLWMKDHELDSRLTEMERLGVTWIRVDFSWAVIQSDSSKVYHWQMYDRVVRAAKAHHLKILAVLAYTPSWAQESRCAALVITKAAGTRCNPRSKELFGRFARAAAIRYKGSSIRAWEIWNEPNLSAYWKTAQPGSKAVHADPKAYAAVANFAALQIRHYYPDSAIITGGLAPLFEPKYPKGLRQSDFLAQVLPLLEPRLFDGIGIHPYSWPALPGKAVVYNAFYSVDKGRPEYNLRLIMQKAGWGHKQLWATEYGASTKGLISKTDLKLGTRADHVTEGSQAQIVSQGVDLWYRKSNVGPLFVHSDSDQWLSHRKNEGGFGLRRTDGSKKPAYDAFHAAVKRLQ